MTSDLLVRGADPVETAAGGWLAPSIRADLVVVHAFCRAVDDLGDAHADGEALLRLRDELLGRRPAGSLVAAFLRTAGRRGVPVRAAADLVEAVHAELGPVRIRDETSLLAHAYAVGGTIGLLVSPILGAAPGAAPYAVALGQAIRLTTLARDVVEHARRDRVYLPASWLAAAGARPEDVRAGRAAGAVFAVVRRVLERAEALYAEAEEGYALLPWRSRVAVAIAASRHRAIGRAILRRGPKALAERPRVGWLARLAAALAGLLAALRAGPGPRRIRARRDQRGIAT